MKAIVALLAAGGMMVGMAGAAAAGEVKAGTYAVQGANFDGSPYSGTATISITSNSTCRITWKTGGTSSSGICMRDEDSFAAAYKMGNAIGLVIYKINDDGSLEGVWTIADKPGAGKETLTPR